MAFQAILLSFGWTLIVFAVALASPILVALPAGEVGEAALFAVGAALAGFMGAGLVFALTGRQASRPDREAAFYAGLTLLTLPIFGAIPFMASPELGGPVGAYFEAVSAVTTTGATAYPSLEATPQSLLFWRSLLAWLGGLGAIVFASVILVPVFSPGLPVLAIPLPAIERSSLFIRLRRMTIIVGPVYAALLIATFAALWIAGLAPFEALCLALAASSTTGFLTRDGNLDAYGAPMAEVVILVAVLVGATNLLLIVYLSRGWIRSSVQTLELRMGLQLAALAGSATAIAALLASPSIASLWAGFFNGVSLLTTTAFSVGGPDVLSATPLPLVFAAIFIGGSAVSTAGGIKLVRAALFFRLGLLELARLAHPHRVAVIRFGTHQVGSRLVDACWAFVFLFIGFLLVGTLGVTVSGVPFVPALTAAAATMSNAGPALAYAGDVSYAEFPAFAKLVLAGLMIAGRLEILALLALLNPAYWRG